MPAKKLNKDKITGFLWPCPLWRRILNTLAAIVILFTAASYGVAQWYIAKHRSQPLVLGTTFISDYAQSFGLNPKDTLNAILGDLKLRQVRLVSYWDQIEPAPGRYDFSNLDWQFAMANQYGVKVSLAIGLRQPRWPECPQPAWAAAEPKNERQLQLYSFIRAVIDRYKNNPALETYELENEFFMSVFGECKDFDRSRFINEFKLVKQWDPNHPVIISRSNNWVGVPVRQPTPDKSGISIYKRVWDKTLTHRYFEYPLPAWFYASLAGWEEMLSGKDMIIHELQAEPWPPTDIHTTAMAEQYKSMDAKRLKDRIAYGKATGMRNIDLWGAEWWYWAKVKQHDPSIWNVVKDAAASAEMDNVRLLKN